jgi:hypothetical protein
MSVVLSGLIAVFAVAVATALAWLKTLSSTAMRLLELSGVAGALAACACSGQWSEADAVGWWAKQPPAPRPLAAFSTSDVVNRVTTAYVDAGQDSSG